MTSYLQQYLGQFVINASNEDLDVGGQPIRLDRGLYYLAGYTGETREQLCENLQAKIREVAGLDLAEVDYNATTGRVSFYFEADTDVEMSASLARILGFSDPDQLNASVYTGDRNPRYVWRPTYGLSRCSVSPGKVWKQNSMTRVYRTESGMIYTMPRNALNETVIDYFLLPEADVVTPDSGTIYRDFQQWFYDVAHSGRPFRYYPDRTLNAAGNLVHAILYDGDGEAIGALDKYIQRYQDGGDGLWSVTVPMIEHIPYDPV